MSEVKEKTAPITAVGAAVGQSIPDNETSITDAEAEYKKKLLEIQKFCNPAYLNTLSMNELFDYSFTSRPPLIDGLLYAGTYLLAGAPFLVAQLAYHVSTGQPLWDYNVHQGNVLYLALEDDYQRLQGRMSRMFGVEGTDNLNFAVASAQIGDGLNEQLENFLKDRPDTKLIIIDTLQKIREAVSEAYSYASDYDAIGQLKSFATYRGICLLLVHHTRKQPADDKFEMISGTTGLLGCADGAFLLRKEKRTDLTETLDVVGRDQPDQRLHLTRDEDRLTWQLDYAERELWRAPPDPLLEKTAALVTPDTPEWCGSPSELASVIGTDLAANVLTRHLNVNAARLKNDYHIEFERRLRHEGRRIIIRLLPAGDAAPA